MARAVFFPFDWIVVTQLILRSAETSMFTSSSFWESMPIAARLHPPHPPPSVFAQTLGKVEATDCRRSRRIEPCVDLRHSLFPFRSRILQGHILGESLSCVTRNFQLICVQQNPFYRFLQSIDWFTIWRVQVPGNVLERFSMFLLMGNGYPWWVVFWSRMNLTRRVHLYFRDRLALHVLMQACFF